MCAEQVFKAIASSVAPDCLQVGIILLAAGGSTRLGTPKQLLPYGDRSLIRHVTQIAADTRCQATVVVLGAAATQIALEISDLGVQTVVNDHWSQGIGSSIACGLQMLTQLHPDIAAAMFLTCDQPFISASLLHDMIALWHSSGKMIACEYSDTYGIPALFGQLWFATLNSLQGDQGAKRLLRQHPDQMLLVPFPQGVVDIDTPEDYRKCLNPETGKEFL